MRRLLYEYQVVVASGHVIPCRRRDWLPVPGNYKRVVMRSVPFRNRSFWRIFPKP